MVTIREHQLVMLELLEEFDRVCKKNDIKYLLFAGSALGAVRHGGFIPWDDDLDVALLRDDYEKLMNVASSEWSEKYYLQREFSEHWPLHFSKLRKNNTTCLEKFHPKDSEMHQGIYIDIFPIDAISEHKVMQYIQFIASRVVIAKTKDAQGYETNSLIKKIVMLISRLLPMKVFLKIATNRAANQSNVVHSFFGGSISFSKGIFNKRVFIETEIVKFEQNKFPISKHFDKMLSQQYGNYLEIPSEEKRKQKVHAILVDTEKDYSHYKGYRDGMKFDVLTRSIR